MSSGKPEYPVNEGDVKTPPMHPGELLREVVLPELRMSVAEVASKLGVTRQTLYRIIRERTAVTPEMAVRLGKFCDNGPNLWMALQTKYDLWHAERRLKDAIDRIQPARRG